MDVLRAAIVLLVAWGAVAPLGAAPEEKTISVNLKNADVRQVIAYILRGTDVNYAFADGVDGRVSCGLHDVPVERALQAILSAAGCESVEDEGALLIRKRVPPPAPVPATAPPAAAAGQDAASAGESGRAAAELRAREGQAGTEGSAPPVYYVFVPILPQANGNAAAYGWPQGNGGMQAGANTQGFGFSRGPMSPGRAWFEQVAMPTLYQTLGPQAVFRPFAVPGFGRF